MIYTYEISFNGSDYLSFTPTVIPKITTSKEADDFIWRDEVDGFKINEELNSEVYGILESWYDDSDKVALVNIIRIKKSDVVKYSFTFGIKQGKLNYENKFYSVQPEVLDVYTNLMFYKNRTVTPGDLDTYQYVNEDQISADGVDEIYETTSYQYYDWMSACETYLDVKTGDAWNIESAFLWNDNYPDGSSSGTLNYVSSDYNYLNDFAIRQSDDGPGYMSIDHLLNVPKMFQCYYYVSSDYTIHLEHVSWFRDQIQNSQLDISGEDYYDDSREFEYSSPEFVSVERFKFPSDDVILIDYQNAYIQYAPELVNWQDSTIETVADYDAYITSDFLDKFITSGNVELVTGYSYVSGWTAFTHSSDSPDITDGNTPGSSAVARTNFVADAGTTIAMSYDIDITYISTPVNSLYIQGYTDNTPNGSPVLLASGSNTGSVNGNHIRFTTTGAQTFTFTIDVTYSGRYRIPWEDGQLSSTSRQNNYFSWANILNRFWKDYRYAADGTLNGVEQTFNSVRPLKDQVAFKFYYADDIDPMRGITTDYGIGMIQSMERDLATDFITLKLRYE